VSATVLLGDAALSLNVRTRVVRTASGRELQADAVVIATGARARTLLGQTGLAGVHTLRSMDDALALRSVLHLSERVVVIGDGVLGAEIAAAARTRGVRVTLIGEQPAPLADRLGVMAAPLLAALHHENGVELRPGTAVDCLASYRGRVTGVCLRGGEILPADLVVVAVGAVPMTEWLIRSGLVLDGGVVCDARCAAAENVYAAGDVARWYHEGVGGLLRLENRTNAVDQAAVVAGNLLGGNRSYAPVPYFWTRQFDARVQIHGFSAPDAEATVVEGSPEQRRFVAVYRRQGRTIGVLGWNMPKQAHLHARAMVSASAAHHARDEPATARDDG